MDTPATFLIVIINLHPISYILIVLSGRYKRRLADAIVRRRKINRFTSNNELGEFVKEQKLEADLVNDFKYRACVDTIKRNKSNR